MNTEPFRLGARANLRRAEDREREHGNRAGLIPLERLLYRADERSAFLRGTFQRWQLEGVRPVRRHSDQDLRQAFRSLLPKLGKTFKLKDRYSGARHQRATLRALTSFLITRYATGDDDIGRPIAVHELDTRDKRLVLIDPVADREITMLKQLVWFYVIQRPSLAAEQIGQRRVVRDLFRMMVDSAAEPKLWPRLPIGSQEQLRNELRRVHEVDHPFVFSRLAADTICGLSEHQALALD